MIDQAIFRAYDIRGRAHRELDAAAMRDIGHAIGSEALSLGIDALLFGRDARCSSPALGDALQAGVRASGCTVVDLGVIHTPLLYFGTYTTVWDSGVMVTASHNPADYNGVKIVLRRAALADDQIQRIRRRIESGDLLHGNGACQTLDLRPAYLQRILDDVQLQRPLRVVVDCGNAVTALTAPALLTELGCDVIPLYCNLDGRFPHHDPDPTQPDNLGDLRAAVQQHGADLGVAFDGDGDRLALVAEGGEIINTDQLLALLVQDVVPRHPGRPVIFDVKCSNRLEQLVRDLGGCPIMHRSGHSFMKQKMQATGAVLGGEFSAHVFILDRWFGFDDGIYAAARALEILSREPTPVSVQMRHFGQRPNTPELMIDVSETQKFAVMEQVLRLTQGAGRPADLLPGARLITLDGLRAEYPDGWGLVRASNTSPALLMRFEADSPAALRRIQRDFASLLLQADPGLPIGFPVSDEVH